MENMKNLVLINETAGFKLYGKKIDEKTARYFQYDESGKMIYSFLGRNILK